MLANTILLSEGSIPRGIGSAALIPTRLRALLDDCHLSQLREMSSHLHYDPDFRVAGNELGIEPPTMLCEACRKLMKNPPKHFIPTARVTQRFHRCTWAWPPSEYWVPHHNTFFELIHCCYSSKGRCHLCHLFWHSFRRQARRHRHNGTKLTLEWKTRALGICLYETERRTQYSTFNLCLNLPEKVLNSESRLIHLKITRVDSGDFPFPGTLSNYTGSAETFSRIENWMRYCVQNHAQCQHPRRSPSELPTRLVAIADGGKYFRLTTQVPENAAYLTLSYRWGPEVTPYALTRKTFGELKKWNSAAVLPKTLRDACSTTNRLGFRYLWIDKLCIFQDSREDWDHEASRMAHVYKNSFCTISATGAINDDGGCFLERSALGIQPLKLAANTLVPGNTYFYTGPPDSKQKEGKLGHLANRGWVFQEWNLSRRIVHFSQEQVHWECMEVETDETWPLGRPLWFESPQGGWFDLERPWLEVAVDAPMDIYHIWRRVVEDYSGRKLTRESDKLPALAGIAREMQRVRRDEYVAGLWRRWLLLELCWSHSQGTARRPKSYRAPSWSWASVDASVSGPPAVASVATRLADVKDVRIHHATENVFGEVHDGWVVLCGHPIPVSIRPERGATESAFGFHLKVFQRDGTAIPFNSTAATVRLDVDFAFLNHGTAPIYCVPLLDLGTLDKPCAVVCCLLLVPTGTVTLITTGAILAAPPSTSNGEYHRVGLARLYVHSWNEFLDWLSGLPRRDIVIR